MNANFLSLAIWVPILGAIPVLLLGSERRFLVRWVALAVALAGFAVTLPLYTGFDTTQSGMQFVEQIQWVPRFNLEYLLGVDGISMPFILLNSFITIMVVLAGWDVIEKKQAQYMGAFLIMSGLMNGIFSALDGILFYVFFEASLIPMYLIIGVWGGPNRVYAAIKFFLYTLLGSLLMLVALIWLFLTSGGSANILDWHQLQLGMTPQILIFIAFLISFAVKVPMWPVHTWLPDAHVEAPTGGSVVLAAIALKLGAYGFIRFSLPIAPDASHYLAPLMIALSLTAVIYIGFVALVQTDMKKLVAYSSISHMGFVTLGFFIFSPLGIEGSLVQMIRMVLFLPPCSCVLAFCTTACIRDRLRITAVSSIPCPSLLLFSCCSPWRTPVCQPRQDLSGEFMVILGAVKFNFWVGTAAAVTLILGAAYTLWMYKRVVFGEITNPHVADLSDIGLREFLILALLAACVLAMGLYPYPFTEVMHASVDNLLKHVAASKL
jgi:NADH-quinone oxidoreductase subunit M